MHIQRRPPRRHCAHTTLLEPRLSFSVGFLPAFDLAVGNVPRGNAIADLNTDGRPDLVTANYTSGSVSIHFAAVDGTFAAPQTVSVGATPVKVVTGDLNRDGRLDLITANYSGGGRASVRLGNGNGTFQGQTLYPLGGGPVAVTLGDFDRDGDLDLAGVNSESNTVTVLRGTGTGTFSPLTASDTHPVPGVPYDAEATDLDGDGWLDLATANASGSVSVLLNNRSGGFNAAMNYSTSGGEVRWLAAGDVDRDGDLDIVAAGEGGGIVLLRSLGNGFFATPERLPYMLPSSSVKLVDMDSDGILDVVNTTRDNKAHILIGRGDGGFDTPLSWTVGTDPRGVAVGDLNRDSRPDIVVTAGGAQAISVLMSASATVPAFSFSSPALMPAGSVPRAVAVGDFNRDGISDAVVANAESNNLSLFLGRIDGTFAVPVPIAGLAGPVHVIAVDVDSDGDTDLASAEYGDRLAIRLNRGDGTFDSPTSVVVGGGPVALVAGDLDGDSRVDIAVCTEVSNNALLPSVTIFWGTGGGQFLQGPRFAVGAGTNAVVASDFNGDGRLDLATADAAAHGISVLLNQGNRSFGSRAVIPTAGGPRDIVAADLDGDGRIDLATATLNGSNAGVLVLRGNGDGTFFGLPVIPTASVADGLAVGDFNQDGALDLVGGGDGGVVVITGDGSGGFAAPVVFNAGGNSNRIAAGDFDRDGQVDLACALNGGSLAVLTNETRRASVKVASFNVEAPSNLLSFRFNKPVGASLSVGDFEVINRTTGATIESAFKTLSYTTSNNTVTLTFPGFNGGILPDGDYRVTLRGENVNDAAGTPMAADHTQDFFILAGDANRDRRVDFADLVILAQNYGQSGRSFTQANFDYSSNGKVDFSDLVILAQRYGVSLVTSASLSVPVQLSPGPRRRPGGMGIQI